jgi:hypothetical protein
MEVIAALHSQLTAANAELVALESQVDENAKAIAALIESTRERREKYTAGQEEVRSKAMLLKEAQQRLRAKQATCLESVLAPGSCLLQRLNDMLEHNRSKSVTIKAQVAGAVAGSADREHWGQRATDLQKELERQRDEVRTRPTVSSQVAREQRHEELVMLRVEEQDRLLTEVQAEMESYATKLAELRTRSEGRGDWKRQRSTLPGHSLSHPYAIIEEPAASTDQGFEYDAAADDSVFTGYTQHTLTRTVQYEAISYPPMSTAPSMGSSGFRNVPWYRQTKMRSPFQTGNELLHGSVEEIP